MILAVGVSLFIPQASYTAGVLMLGGAAIGITMVPMPLKWVSGILIGVGATAFFLAMVRGYSPIPAEFLTVNQALIGMITAVSFLQLITPQERPAKPRLSGRAAVWRTTGIVHLLGSVINMTVVSSAGDHLRSNKVLATSDALLISRAFSSGAFWSPFWAASAAALTYAPGAQISIVFACGAALACVAIAFSSESTVRLLGKDLQGYRGYALTRSLLQVPVVMVAVIILIHVLAPNLPVAKLVLVCSIVITTVVLYWQDRHFAFQKIARHVVNHVPNHYGELTLFASAGLLAVGLKAFLSVTPVSLPFDDFGVVEAWLSITMMVALGLVGVHPVVSMAALAALAAQMEPDPTLFALAAVIGWGCSIVVSPTSVLLVLLNRRYLVGNLAVMRGNAPYLISIIIAAYPTLMLCDILTKS